MATFEPNSKALFKETLEVTVQVQDPGRGRGDYVLVRFPDRTEHFVKPSDLSPMKKKAAPAKAKKAPPKKKKEPKKEEVVEAKVEAPPAKKPAAKKTTTKKTTTKKKSSKSSK